MQYLEDEKRCGEAAAKFKEAFSKIENAIIFKSQTNGFGLKYKYPILFCLCIIAVAVVIISQITLEFYDALYIICEVIILFAMAAFCVMLIRTWLLTINNAKLAERIVYYNGGKKCLVTEITAGGTKVEWQRASLYMRGDDYELIESETKEYNPYFYKKVHGHSRGFRLLDSDFLVETFFLGATVLSSECGKTVLSTGFTFTIEHGSLKEFEIIGFCHECYENNFPIVSIFTQSGSYTFKYEFAAINVPNFRLVLPANTAAAARLYFAELPKDPHIFYSDK